MDPTEQIAVVVTGWATAWAVNAVFNEPTPAVMLGLIIGAFLRGSYRRRWTRPAS